MFRYSDERVKSILDNYVEWKQSTEGVRQCTVYKKFIAGNGHMHGSKQTKKYVTPTNDSLLDFVIDIDMAVDSMGKLGRWNKYCTDIEQHPRDFGLNPKQFAVAQYIRGEYDNIDSIISEIADILSPQQKKPSISTEPLKSVLVGVT